MQPSTQQSSFTAVMLGCGDAYDTQRHNSGLLVTEGDYSLLIDCGPWLTRRALEYLDGPEQLDGIYITHAHPDHALGLTTLLNWMDSKQRRHPLTIYLQRSQARVIEALVSYAYWPNDELGFAIEYRYIEDINCVGPWKAQFAVTKHAVDNFSIRLQTQGKHSLFFSGDGELSELGTTLAAQSDWVFIECQTLKLHTSHGSWEQIKTLPKRATSRWRLYHVSPEERGELIAALHDQPQIQMAHEGERLVAKATESDHHCLSVDESIR